MDWINHFTLNTGDTVKRYAKEIDRERFYNFYREIDGIIKSRKRGSFYMNTHLLITVENDYYAATLFADKEGKLPVLFTTGTSDPGKRSDISKSIFTFEKILHKEVSHLLPAAPLIVDAVLPPSILRPDVLSITADISFYLAWSILDPGNIILR